MFALNLKEILLKIVIDISLCFTPDFLSDLSQSSVFQFVLPSQVLTGSAGWRKNLDGSLFKFFRHQNFH